MYLSIDPGLDMGWALWNSRALLACGFGDPRTCKKHVVTSDSEADVIHDVWIEDQVIYARSPVPPQDILKLAKGAHRFAGRYDALGVVVHFVEPSQWKGQVPCNCGRTVAFAACTHHSRVWAQLTDAERDVVDQGVRGMAPGKRHNVLDAIGIGLWVRRFGRLERAQ